MLFRGSSTNGRRLPFSAAMPRPFRLVRIPLIEKEINRRTRGLIKFYEHRRCAGAYSSIIYDTSSSPRDSRSWCAPSFSLFFFLCFSLALSLSHTRLHLYLHKRSYHAPTKTTGAGNHRPPRCRSEIYPDLAAVTSYPRQNLGQKCR